MRVEIAAIGKKRGGPEASLVEDYLDRARGFGKRIGFSDFALSEQDAPKSLSGPALKKRESELLLKTISDGAQIVALDERGENISSEKFAAFLAQMRDDGRAATAFVIGGADGHDEDVRQRASRLISFGAATWPN